MWSRSRDILTSRLGMATGWLFCSALNTLNICVNMEQVERENNTRQQETMRYDIEANAD